MRLMVLVLVAASSLSSSWACSREPAPGGTPATTPGTAATASAPSAGTTTAATSGNPRGPGLKAPAPDALPLSVPRTFDLTHVSPEHYAAALGKDPDRIFAFVRDHIAFEAYTGVLRGARGTLLAMAGNAADRAALVASLLEHSGQKVRFARGSLSEADARQLAESIFAERAGIAVAPPEVSPGEKTALSMLGTRIERDYSQILQHLKQAGVSAPPGGPTAADLIAETRSHYWVQLDKGGTWVDFDPSFADSSPGRAHTTVEQTLAALPADIFHRVEIRVRLEEYPIAASTSDAVKPESRVALTYRANAADLSAVDLSLTHQPDAWKGPVSGLGGAVSSAIEATGLLVPVLTVGGLQWQIGAPFRAGLPSGTGIGGIGGLLGGAGTRNAVPVATAETVEIDLIAPGGQKETVTREIFDLAGAARRRSGNPLSADEIRERTAAGAKGAHVNALHTLLFTTGALHASQLANVVDDPAPAADQPIDLRRGMRRVLVLSAAASDSLLERVGHPDRALVRFYLASPRVTILDLSEGPRGGRVSIDLRRDRARAVAQGPAPQDVFYARILRGVAEGTWERVLMEVLDADAPAGAGAAFTMSTSGLFDRLADEKVPVLLLSAQTPPPDNLPPDADARLRVDLAAGHLALAPRRAVTIGGQPRFAWWRIEPKTGETVAVSDEGLHQTSVEYHYVKDEKTGEVTIVRLEYTGRTLTGHEGRQFAAGSRALGRTLRWIADNGGQLIYRGRIIPNVG